MKTSTVFTLLVVAAGLGAFGGYKLTASPVEQGSALKWNLAGASDAPPAPMVDFRSAAKHIMPSVVSVDRLERTQNFWTDEVSMQQTASGSGVIVSADGYILTNNHVVADADVVQVHLADQRQIEAKVVGTDPRSDIAVLKIDAKNILPAEIGGSSKLEVGEWVLAVGNPLGYANTVSVGVVSSLKRTLATDERSLLVDTIQTDAAINQGNSGGALANAKGQLVGINSAIASPTGGSVGIGFAIPIDRAKLVADDIIKYGRAKYGSLGLDIFTRPGLLRAANVREEIAQRVGAAPPQSGVVVRRVLGDGAARSAGIEPLDILVEINGKAIADPIDYAVSMADKRPGDKIALKVWSKGKEREVQVELLDR